MSENLHSDIKKKPGVMIYFEIKNLIKRLDLEGKGRLFDAILNYSENGIEPEFREETDIALCMAWDFIQPKIDNDSLRYEKKCEDASNAAKKRWQKNIDTD